MSTMEKKSSSSECQEPDRAELGCETRALSDAVNL